jgi:GT2 family glycosyltransferase
MTRSASPLPADHGESPRPACLAPDSVAIVIVNWNGWRDTIRCIESCLALNHRNCRIVVCDNASSDGSIDHLAQWARGESSAEPDPDNPVPAGHGLRPAGFAVLDRAEAEAGGGGDAQLLLVRTGGNLGFAGGNNVGLRWAIAQGFAYYWLLNNDAVAAPDALDRLLARFALNPRIGLCGSTLIEYFSPADVQAYAGACHLGTFRGRHLGEGDPIERALSDGPHFTLRKDEIFYPVGASMLASRAFVEQVGLLEAGYFLYYEEVDWVLRGRHSFHIELAPDSLVYHKGGATAGSLAAQPSARALAYLYRSRLRVARRLGKGSLTRVLLGMGDEAARHLVRGKIERSIALFNVLAGRVSLPEGFDA